VQRVHLAPLWSVVGGALGLAAIGWLGALSTAGWIAGMVYLVVSNALLIRGLRRSHAIRFGPANATTAFRSTLVGLITALIATSFTSAIPLPIFISLTVVALALDGVDGWIARRTRTMSELGAQFDMEVDAFLLLVLSVYVGQQLGWWVLVIGLLRYAFVAAGWPAPWMRTPLPPRYWRKVVTAVAGIALTVVASELAPWWADYAVMFIALALLLESFTRDVLWLFVHRHDAPQPARVGPRRAERGAQPD